MDKILEDYLWSRIKYNGEHGEYSEWPRDVINDMIRLGMIKSPKQAWRTLEKWSCKGLYAWGSTIDLGWKIKN